MQVGQQSSSGFRAQTNRTKEKIDENLELLVSDIKQKFGLHCKIESSEEQSLRYILYNALLWTADDVLAQAVDDGYVSKQNGVVLF